jgi:hypothetical protein
MNPTALVHMQPEMLSKYAQAAVPVTPRAAPRERMWAGVAGVATLVLAALLIALAA